MTELNAQEVSAQFADVSKDAVLKAFEKACEFNLVKYPDFSLTKLVEIYKEMRKVDSPIYLLNRIDHIDIENYLWDRR